MSVKRLILKQGAVAGGGAESLACECQYHAHAYNEMVGTTSQESVGCYQDSFDDGVTILSQAITITETSCVQAVGTIVGRNYVRDPDFVNDFELERPLGSIVVDQEDLTQTDRAGVCHYSSWEVLSPGIYTYYLVNRAGATRYIFAAQLKIIAFSCTGPPCACQHHAHAYNAMVGETVSDVSLYYDSFDDGVTILSQVITITETCCVQAVGTIIDWAYCTIEDFELERPLGSIVVDQEDLTDSFSVHVCHYSSWEVLSPGIYTYYLVNRAGVTRRIYAAQLKIIAVYCA